MWQHPENYDNDNVVTADIKWNMVEKAAVSSSSLLQLALVLLEVVKGEVIVFNERMDPIPRLVSRLQFRKWSPKARDSTSQETVRYCSMACSIALQNESLHN